MDYIALARIAIDVLLLLGVGALAYQLMRLGSIGPATDRVAELERSMRALLREAEGASRSLTDQLSRRQQTLEQLLFDLGTVESRINRAIASAEEKRSALDRGSSAGIERTPDDEFSVTPDIPAKRSAAKKYAEALTPLVEQVEKEVVVPPSRAPKSDEIRAPLERVAHSARAALEATRELNADLGTVSRGRTLNAPRRAAPQIDEFERDAMAEKIGAATLQAGQEIPMDGRSPSSATRARDPRLGVLGGMRREMKEL